jgi:hypothetical protein
MYPCSRGDYEPKCSRDVPIMEQLKAVAETLGAG